MSASLTLRDITSRWANDGSFWHSRRDCDGPPSGTIAQSRHICATLFLSLLNLCGKNAGLWCFCDTKRSRWPAASWEEKAKTKYLPVSQEIVLFIHVNQFNFWFKYLSQAYIVCLVFDFYLQPYWCNSFFFNGPCKNYFGSGYCLFSVHFSKKCHRAERKSVI